MNFHLYKKISLRYLCILPLYVSQLSVHWPPGESRLVDQQQESVVTVSQNASLFVSNIFIRPAPMS